MTNNYHVIWRPDGWAIRREGGLKDTITRIPTKDSALQQGKELAQKSGGELIPHRKDNGQFSKHGRNSYGNDPFPPRG